MVERQCPPNSHIVHRDQLKEWPHQDPADEREHQRDHVEEGVNQRHQIDNGTANANHHHLPFQDEPPPKSDDTLHHQPRNAFTVEEKISRIKTAHPGYGESYFMGGLGSKIGREQDRPTDPVAQPCVPATVETTRPTKEDGRYSRRWSDPNLYFVGFVQCTARRAQVHSQ